MPPVPKQIGPYEVREEIGRGGMGVVYLARDARLVRDVAIKSLSPGMAGSADRLARFRREARIIAQLNHPHIVQVHQLLEHGDAMYLVLEYVPGRSLAEVIRDDGALDPPAALDLGTQVARALEAAHCLGIVHRDLKPANVRVTADGTAKVLDFGIARGSAECRPRSEDLPVCGGPAGETGDDVRATIRVGTPGYMAPEQARGDPVDARADLFSLGCILYECLAGEPAFRGGTPDALIDATLRTTPDFAKLPASLPDGVAPLVRQCLARHPDDRPRSMAEARAALELALGRRPTPSTDGLPQPEVPNNLPQPTTSFVGRGRALHELADLLERARLVTLTGLGGCGKTRLALELARRVMTRFPDGVHVADLAATAKPALVPAAVASALGVKDRPGATTLEALCGHLASGTVLIVLDNCEHVLDAASELAGALLQAAPRLRIVATSRETLRAPGEHLWPVPGLVLPVGDDPGDVAAAEAVELFVDRARSVRPAFALSDDNAAAVARICRQLDGAPLAIELAAARTNVFTPAEIETRLADRFRLLAGVARGVPDRHRTLRAAVDWSYLVLSASEQRMLRALAVFAGGWTLDAAVAVCGPGGHAEDGGDLDDLAALDLLTHLVDKSLVLADRVSGASRYRLLETVRQYALEKLVEAGEADVARARHLDLHLALAEDAAPHFTEHGQAAWLERIEAEHGNMLAALDHATEAAGAAEKALRICWALMRLWLVHGHYRTGLDACGRALDHPDAGAPTVDRARALHAAAVMAQALAEYDRSRALSTAALEIMRELGDEPGIARSLNSLGNSAYYRGDLEAAKRLHGESLEINRRLGDERGVATSLNNLANVASDRGAIEEARRLYQAALESNRRSGNRAGEAINLNNLGLMALHRIDRDESARLHGESLAIRRDLGDRHGIAESLCQLARLARDRADLAAARARHAESLAMRRELGDQLGLTDSLDGIAMLATRLGDHPRAGRILGVADALRDRIGAPRPAPDIAEVSECLAASRAALGAASFDEAVAAGRARPLDTALDDTLAWLEADRVDTAAPTRLLTERR
ncbi:MAG: protein kinase domain-containing protein [Planctomycetota bacterium]|jgi:non-specific serine/threonine protein kinase